MVFFRNLDPLELVLNSTNTQGVLYCNGRVDINKQRNKLTASFDPRIPTPPAFQLKTEQANSTTIRIYILPNGHIGAGRISCYWDNNISNGQTADLIVGGSEIKKKHISVNTHFKKHKNSNPNFSAVV
jgi:hypothetical protein